MIRGFDQQDRSLNFSVPKTAPSPQHGRVPDKQAAKLKKPRAFQPPPGH
jgi:hypothetical protein